MATLEKTYTNIQVFLMYFIGIFFVIYGIVQRYTVKKNNLRRKEGTQMIYMGLVVLATAVIITLLRQRFKNFDTYFTAFGIMS